MWSMVGKKVRALDNHLVLVKGQVYTIVEEDDDLFYLQEVSDGYLKTRFELVTTPFVKIKHSKAIEDAEEKRLRAIFTQPRAGNCPCGMAKQSCEYHREEDLPPILTPKVWGWSL
jgi:hypothetical protein